MLSIQLETTLTLSPKKKKEKEFTGPKNPTCVERAPDIAIPTARGTGPKFAGSRDVVVFVVVVVLVYTCAHLWSAMVFDRATTSCSFFFFFPSIKKRSGIGQVERSLKITILPFSGRVDLR